MFDRTLTLFLQSIGKGSGNLKHALSVASSIPEPEVNTIIFNYIGENTTHYKGIYKATANYYSILKIIRDGSKREISIKPSQFNYNMTLLKHLARDVNIKRSVLWIDAEEYDQAKRQFRLALDLSSFLSSGPKEDPIPPNSIGLCIQLKNPNCVKYARRCFDKNIKVRLCKGAYSWKIDQYYLSERAERIVEVHKEYKKDLLEIATIRDVSLVMLALENELPLQILYGYHQKLMDYPYITKVYLPFGTNWWPYIKRRIREKF